MTKSVVTIAVETQLISTNLNFSHTNHTLTTSKWPALNGLNCWTLSGVSSCCVLSSVPESESKIVFNSVSESVASCSLTFWVVYSTICSKFSWTLSMTYFLKYWKCSSSCFSSCSSSLISKLSSSFTLENWFKSILETSKYA